MLGEEPQAEPCQHPESPEINSKRGKDDEARGAGGGKRRTKTEEAKRSLEKGKDNELRVCTSRGEDNRDGGTKGD